MTSVGTPLRKYFWPAAMCALAGGLVFQFLGNSTRGYIGSSSLFYWWGFQWVDPGSETQHGFLILGISLWLAGRNLRSASPASAPSARAGAAAMIAGLLVHVAGFTAEQARLSIVGLLLFAWGVVALGGGSRWARALLFPLAYLLFAVPLNALDSAGFWLRMGVVALSARIVHGFGIGVLVNGTQLLSPDGRYNYDVAAACSGIRSLLALSALSLLMGYLRFRPFGARAFLFALSFPLIFVGNVARIVGIVIAAQVGGQIWGDRVHEVMGFGVFAIVLGGAMAATELLTRLFPAWVVPAGGRPEPEAATGEPERAGPRPWAVGAAVLAAALAAAVLLAHVSGLPLGNRSGIMLQAGGHDPVPLPVFIGDDWIGRRTEVTELERQVLPPDTGFSRKLYVSVADPTKQVFLSLVLSGRDRTSIHRPELCLVGQGWTIRGSFGHQFSFPGQARGFPATVLRVEKQALSAAGRFTVPQLFAYYFVGADEVVATHWERIGRDAWERLAHGRSDRWAYVVVQTGSADGETAALQRIQAILDGTLPSFQKHG